MQPHAEHRRVANAEPPDAEVWDVVIVGTGMGGATVGFALAAAGRRVLFCEQGRVALGADAADDDTVVGLYPEMLAAARGAVPVAAHREILRRAGRSAEALVDISGARPRSFIPFVGAGSGGSSALYGMLLERFRPMDFEPAQWHPDAPGSTLPDAWPIRYDELRPYYERAEDLFRLRGEPDPLALRDGVPPRGVPLPASPGWTAAATGLAAHLQARGLHPFHPPVACAYVPGCEHCQGVLCGRSCKHDAGRICLEPAVRDHAARVLGDCTVLELLTEGRRVERIACDWAGTPLMLRARQVVLAAGALRSPALLLQSRAGLYGHGIGNRHGQVGRHLMRHFTDVHLVPSRHAAATDFDNRAKEIAFNDFYCIDGQKLGTVQSFGRLPPEDMLVAALRDDAASSSLAPSKWLVDVGAPALRWALRRMVSSRLALATLVEDLPYADNAVLPPSRPGEPVRFRYALRAEAHHRVRSMRVRMRDAAGPQRWTLLKQAEVNQRLAHVCGTCRFGDDPRSSALDRNNRVHDVDNLHVVDGSFLPSSGGTNPSLTIAANALRVADHLVACS